MEIDFLGFFSYSIENRDGIWQMCTYHCKGNHWNPNLNVGLATLTTVGYLIRDTIGVNWGMFSLHKLTIMKSLPSVLINYSLCVHNLRDTIFGYSSFLTHTPRYSFLPYNGVRIMGRYNLSYSKY